MALSLGSGSRDFLLVACQCHEAFIGEMRALDQFAKEKKVVGRERSSLGTERRQDTLLSWAQACHTPPYSGAAGYYSGLTYLCAKAVAELPSDALQEAQDTGLTPSRAFWGRL